MKATSRARTPVAWGRLIRSGLIAAALSVAANAAIRAATLSLAEVPPEFRPFTWPQFTLFTVLGVLGATLVYAWVLRTAERPAETFRKIAIGVLLISFVPDVALLVTRAVPGMTLATFTALVLMHVATAVIAVSLLAGCPRVRLAPPHG